MNNVIDFLEKRGFIDNITSDELRERVNKPLKAYIGFDPTADSLHLGNLVGIIALAWLEKFGHSPVVLLGGATGKIGDPSGKSTERPLLTHEVLQKNVEGIRKQFHRCLKNPIIMNNDDWLTNYGLVDFLRDVGKHFRVGPMLGKDSVRSRFQSEEGISFTEFSYQVLQGYDFYYLSEKEDVIMQMGGSDQWGNITAGMELTRKLSGKTIYGMTFPLLTRSDGAKFGKSEEGAIWLDPEKTSPYQFYQYLVRVSDEDVIKLMRMLTFMDLEEIETFEKGIQSGDFIPNAAQKRLAEEVTRFVHGEEGLRIALKVTEAAAPGSKASLDPEVLEEIAKDMPHTLMKTQDVIDQTYADVAAKSGLLMSKAEGNRMIKNGGAYLNNEKIDDPSFVIQSKHIIGGKYLLFGAGKKKKILIKIEKELA
ncbi:MAG: tyrosine--tRNA ligase [Chlamydiales bacterium]|nr:tyrosine--tRNA ligase [Chlamydiia bacterium]MCP5504811.1 tyrosine--tRNA ligase [Chlamydiales bacterium]